MLTLPYLLHLSFFFPEGKNARLKLYIIFPPLPSAECCISFSVPAFVLLLYYKQYLLFYLLKFIQMVSHCINLLWLSFETQHYIP